jgi:hypothetical protein
LELQQKTAAQNGDFGSALLDISCAKSRGAEFPIHTRTKKQVFQSLPTSAFSIIS